MLSDRAFCLTNSFQDRAWSTNSTNQCAGRHMFSSFKIPHNYLSVILHDTSLLYAMKFNWHDESTLRRDNNNQCLLFKRWVVQHILFYPKITLKLLLAKSSARPASSIPHQFQLCLRVENFTTHLEIYITVIPKTRKPSPTAHPIGHDDLTDVKPFFFFSSLF